jgi:hypothetical protein
MNSAMQTHSRGVNSGRPDGALAGGGSAKLLSEIVNGIHAIAQPLTILRAAVEVLALPEGGAVNHKRYVEISAKQLERTCNLFSCLQDLVAANLNEAQRERFDLWELLGPMIEDRKTELEASGIGIVVARQVRGEPVMGDAERTEQAVAEVLKMAASVSSRGDVIEMHAFHADGFCELTLQNTRKHGKRISSADRLSLSLAWANIISQNGKYQFAEDPFCVSLALPAQELSQ